MMKKKLAAMMLVFACLLTMAGCQNRSLNDIIQHEDHITGVVREVHENYILIYIDHPGYPGGADCTVSLDVEYKDSMSQFCAGDVVTVYYEGGIMETYPLQVGHVYAILLDTPADRSVNEIS